MSQLALCPHCQRHVRTTEAICPFCASPVANQLVPKSRMPISTRGLSRASILALGASMVAGGALMEGCADEPEPEDDDAGRVVPVYGAPVQSDAGGNKSDAGTAYPDASSGEIDAGSVVAIYGAPVQPKPDAGKPDAGKFDGGSVVAVYGAPIQPPAEQPDAGRADAGRLVPVYGAPMPFYGAPIQPAVGEDQGE